MCWKNSQTILHCLLISHKPRRARFFHEYLTAINRWAYGSVDLTIFDNSTLWLNVSNAAGRSTATQTVRSGSYFWLKLVTISPINCGRVSGLETALACGWKQMAVDGG